MTDLPATSRRQTMECLEAAKDAGLSRVKLGNIHLGETIVVSGGLTTTVFD